MHPSSDKKKPTNGQSYRNSPRHRKDNNDVSTGTDARQRGAQPSATGQPTKRKNFTRATDVQRTHLANLTNRSVIARPSINRTLRNTNKIEADQLWMHRISLFCLPPGFPVVFMQLLNRSFDASSTAGVPPQGGGVPEQ